MWKWLERYWLCFQNKRLTFATASDLITTAGAKIKRYIGHDVADFRGYHCPRCEKYHLERIIFSSDENLIVIQDK